MTDVRYVHQHFDRPAKFGWFTPLEWMLVAVAAVVTAVWWRYVSPFGFSGTATGAVLLSTPLYVYAQLNDGRGGRILRARTRVAVLHVVRPSRAVGGRAERPRGYAIASPPEQASGPEARRVTDTPDFPALWR